MECVGGGLFGGGQRGSRERARWSACGRRVVPDGGRKKGGDGRRGVRRENRETYKALELADARGRRDR